MGVTVPGAAGGQTNNTLVDNGTMCRQASMPYATLGAAGTSLDGGTLFALQSVFNSGPILVGKARRDPGFNFDGTPAEDMMAGDAPAQSTSIRTDAMFAHNDATLAAYLKQLMESLSVGDMETVAVEMADRFCKGTGGTYTSATLDQEIRDNDATLAYHAKFKEELATALKGCYYDATRITPVAMSLLDFSSFWDKATGLGITVHQVWSAKAEIENYSLDSKSRSWGCDLTYTFYDHYGLDWPDIVKHGEDRIPQYHTGDCFKAWYILQHYRKAKPFITEMKRKSFITGAVV